MPIIEQTIKRHVSQLGSILTAARIVGNVVNSTPALSDSLQVAASGPSYLTVQTISQVPDSIPPSGLEQSSPGMVIMFALFFMLGGSLFLIDEREAGTLKRLVMAPVSKAQLLIGKALGILLAGMMQMSVLVTAGIFLFGVNWGHSPVALLLMIGSFSLAITGLGIMIAALGRTMTQATALSTVLVYAMSALGGAWWPIEITPRWMQYTARIFPTYWGMNGFQDIIVRHLGLAEVAFDMFILCSFALLFLSIGIWCFRYE